MAASSREIRHSILALGVLCSLSSSVAAGDAAPRYLGRPLVEVLVELQEGGLPLVFSSRVVDPALRVASEPTSREPAEMLDELLRPHGLEAVQPMTGWLVVQRVAKRVKAADEASPARQLVRIADEIVVVAGRSIPVQVVRDGEPVRGLTAADFRLYVGGERRKITSLEVLDLSAAGARAVGVTSPIRPSIRRHLLLTFDIGSSQPGAIGRAQEAALDLLRSQLHSTDLIGVATYSANRGARVLLPFTGDLSAVVRVITEIGVAAETERGDPQMAETAQHSKLIAAPVEHVETRVETGEDLRPAAGRAVLQAEQHRILGLVDAMTGLARILRYTTGRKQIVLFSGGFDDAHLFGVAGGSEGERDRIEEMNRAVESGEFWKIDADQRYGSSWLRNRVDAMLREFSFANCTIHAVNTATVGSEPRRPAAGGDGLAWLAASTGGTLYSVERGWTKVERGLLDATAVAYVLYFESPRNEEEDRFHRIEVRLRKGIGHADVIHPPGLLAPASYARRSALERRLFVAGRLAAGSPHSDFKSSLAPRPSRAPATAGRRLSIVIEVDAASLLRAHSGGRLALDVYAYAFAPDGSVSGFFGRLVRLEAERVAELEREGGFALEGGFDLAAGEYDVRALIVNEANGATSVSTARVSLPSSAADLRD